MIDYITYVSNKTELANAKQYSKNFPELKIISPYEIVGVKTLPVPFYQTTLASDIFWRLIYASDATEICFISSATSHIDLDKAKFFSSIPNNVFVKSAKKYKFGTNYSSEFFKIKRDAYGFFIFKQLEYAVKNYDEFERFIYAPERSPQREHDIEQLFAHLCISDDCYTIQSISEVMIK
jgi:hypothetical protein